MKETSFIDQNKDKWRRFENLYRSGNTNPDELSALFIEITEDLSYARTHYPKRTVRVYLNGLAQQVFGSLYKVRNNPLRKFVSFWLKSLPLEVYRMQKDILLAFVIFLVAAAIGVVSTADDIDYAKVILGSDYISVTDYNISQGDPMAIYKGGGEFFSFIRIFQNNIQVAFLTFITGLLFGIGTFFVLLYNGIMVGTFQSYFYFKGLLIKKALLYTTFLTIWIHGAFEISAIVLAAAAGFTLGRSLMFPGTMTRLQSLQLGAKRGLKMMIGLAFFIFVAAFFEGYVTRHTEMAEGLKLLIILLSFAIMIFLFVIYPILVARRYPDEVVIRDNPAFDPTIPLRLYKVRTFGEMLSDTFSLYRKNYRYFSKIIWFAAIPICGAMTWYTYTQHYFSLNTWESVERSFGSVLGYDEFMNTVNMIGLPLLFALVFGAVAHSVMKNEEKIDVRPLWRMYAGKLIFTALLIAPFTLAVQADYFFVGFIFLFVATFIFSPVYVYWRSGKPWYSAWSSGMAVGGSVYGSALGIFLVLMGLIVIFSFMLNFQVYTFIRSLVEWHLIMDVTDFIIILQFIRSVFFIIFLFHVIPVLYFAYIILYYHNREIETSTDLFARLENFGKGRKYFERGQWES